MLGRELSSDPLALLVMQPTWGLDISAAHYVRERLLSARDTGVAILLVSEDLDELLALSDRIAVMFKGEFMGILARPQKIPIEKIGLMMAGTPVSEALDGEGALWDPEEIAPSEFKLGGTE
jgi:simple sugar transport system ATP-binding protein